MSGQRRVDDQLIRTGPQSATRHGEETRSTTRSPQPCRAACPASRCRGSDERRIASEALSGTRAERAFRDGGFDRAFEQYWQAVTVGRTRGHAWQPLRDGGPAVQPLDRRVDRARSRVPRPLPVAVARVHPVRGALPVDPGRHVSSRMSGHRVAPLRDSVDRTSEGSRDDRPRSGRHAQHDPELVDHDRGLNPFHVSITTFTSFQKSPRRRDHRHLPGWHPDALGASGPRTDPSGCQPGRCFGSRVRLYWILELPLMSLVLVSLRIRGGSSRCCGSLPWPCWGCLCFALCRGHAPAARTCEVPGRSRR